MKIEAVVFDLDGTLTNSIPLTIYSLKEVTRQLTGKTYSDEDILKEFGPVDTVIIRKLVDNENNNIAEEEYIKNFKENFNRFVKPIDGITELLSFLKAKGFKIGLFTGRSMKLATIILDNLNINDYFDVILSGECTAKPKPDPEGINLALEKLKVYKNNSMYIGDFDVDIAASKAAGVISGLALWAETKSEELLDLKPDVYFRSPYEFIEWIRNISI